MTPQRIYIFSQNMGWNFFILKVINYLINNNENNDADVHETDTDDNNGNTIDIINIINGDKVCVWVVGLKLI